MTDQMITSTEQRKRLEKAGWELRTALWSGEEFSLEDWRSPSWRTIITVRADGTVDVQDNRSLTKSGNLAEALQFASILGISPPGYRLVPEERMKELEGALAAIANREPYHIHDDEMHPSQYRTCYECEEKSGLARAALSPDKKEAKE